LISFSLYSWKDNNALVKMANKEMRAKLATTNKTDPHRLCMYLLPYDHIVNSSSLITHVDSHLKQNLTGLNLNQTAPKTHIFHPVLKIRSSTDSWDRETQI
jgi:hypothetical protein